MSRHILIVIPDPRREFPHRKRDWLRLVVLAVVLVVAVPLFFGYRWVEPRISCRDGFPSEELWSADGECVGISSSGYAFGLDTFAPILAKIDEQNRKAKEGGCPKNATPVTIGVLSTLTSDHASGRAPHELEGIAAGQARANGEGCVHPILLKVGHIGATEQAAESLARMMKDDPDVVSVVGLGLSDQRSADAANVLGGQDRPVPMVASLITAEGFDTDGSKSDNPDYSTCDPEATYPRGVGNGYLYRVAFRNAKQIQQLGGFLGTRPDFVVTPNDRRDPYTCTALPFVRRLGEAPEVKFDRDDPPTLAQAARRICGQSGPVTAFYTARSRDLGRFLHSINKEYGNGLCQSSSITVVSTSDAVRMRVPEPDNDLELTRRQALDSDVFRDGRLRLVYAPLADVDAARDNREFRELDTLFREASFDPAHLDSGWAINGYDALFTVSEAVRTLSAQAVVTRSQVNSAINGLAEGSGRLGAGGTIAFDNAGNRTGEPVIVELCVAGAGERPSTVRVESKKAAEGTACRR